MATVSNSTGNRLLDALSEEDFERLSAGLTPVRLAFKQSIELANQPIEMVFFPTSGILSVVATTRRERQIEVGLIGREGMSGLSVIMGSGQSPNETYVQVEGTAFQVRADALRQAIQQSSKLRDLFLRYVQSFLIQTSQTALANGSAKIEERLARWLLMAQDRLQRPDLPLTHELLSIMLGVRRPGVTEALNSMEGSGLIKATRGVVRLLDRPGVEACANGCYGVPEAEYERLLAPLEGQSGAD